MKREQSTSITFVVIVVLLAFSFFLDYRDRENSSELLFQIATGIGVVTLIIPKARDYFAMGWMKLGHVLGWINSRILLSIVFYIILFPFAMLYRLSKKDALVLRKGRESYYSQRDHLYKKEDLENIW